MAPHTEAAASTDSTRVSVPFLACAVCRRAIEANAESQQAKPQLDLLTKFLAYEAPFKKLTKELHHELQAADRIIHELYDLMPSEQRHIVAARLQFTGLLSGTIGITRSLERDEILAAAKEMGFK